MYDLNVSMVLYHSDKSEVQFILELLSKSRLNIRVYLIDNSSDDRLRDVISRPNEVYIFNGANLGYGSGHNVAIFKGQYDAPYHLVINTDIDFDPEILEKAFNILEANKDLCLISPKILDTQGDLQHFCRQLPTPFDLIARRFLPGQVKKLLKKRLDQYLLLDADYNKIMNIPNLPGCFMFMRNKTLLEVNGFDETFFMYVEDVDLVRRLNERSITLYYPALQIKHNLARGSYKSPKLAIYHIKSAINYFNKWGWLTDKSRAKINADIRVFECKVDTNVSSSPKFVLSSKTLESA